MFRIIFFEILVYEISRVDCTCILKGKRKIECNIGVPVQIKKSQPSGQQRMPETFRHYPLTRGLGFLSLRWRPMFDYFSYL